MDPRKNEIGLGLPGFQLPKRKYPDLQEAGGHEDRILVFSQWRHSNRSSHIDLEPPSPPCSCRWPTMISIGGEGGLADLTTAPGKSS
jgi:hypothetical protein